VSASQLSPEWMCVTFTSTDFGASFLIAFVTFATISCGR
jgi:hypothetical protein